MLNEDAVIESVCKLLQAESFRITASRTTKQKGYDIEAVAPDGTTLVAIEAKGETPTRKSSASFGKPLSPRSVYSAVTTAYFCASTYGPKGRLAGIALPDNPAFRNQVRELLPSLKALQIELFWVEQSGKVNVAGHWKSEAQSSIGAA